MKGFALLIKGGGKGGDSAPEAEGGDEDAEPMGGDEKTAMAVRSLAKAFGVTLKDEAKAVQAFRAAVASCSDWEDDKTETEKD